MVAAAGIAAADTAAAGTAVADVFVHPDSFVDDASDAVVDDYFAVLVGAPEAVQLSREPELDLEMLEMQAPNSACRRSTQEHWS